MREGQNREIRRLMARVGHKVMQLQRVEFGPLRLGRIASGKFRPLKGPEVKALREFVDGLEEQRRSSSSKRLAAIEKRDRVRSSGSSDARGKKPTTSKKPAGKKPTRKKATGKPKRGASAGGKIGKKKARRRSR